LGIAGEKHPFAETHKCKSMRQRNLARFIKDDKIIQRQLPEITETEENGPSRHSISW